MATHYRIAELMQQIAELNALLENENLGKMLKDIKQRKKKGATDADLMDEAEHAIKVIEAHADLAIAKAKLTAFRGE